MRKIVLLLPLFIWANDLSNLINSLEKNEMIKSYDYQIQSLDAQISSVNRGYFPKIDASISGSSTSVLAPDNAFSLESSSIAPNAVAKLSWTLFDGFYKAAKSEDLTAQKNSMKYDKEAMKRDFSMQLTNVYFALLNLKEDLKSAYQKHDMLKAQQYRLEKFNQNGLVTSDEVEKMKSAYLSNQIKIDHLKYNIDKIKHNIALLTNQDVQTLDRVYFKEPKSKELETSEEILSLEEKIKSIDAQIDQVNSAHWPTVYFEDQYIYTYYPDGYEAPSMTLGSSTVTFTMPEQQNKIQFALSMNITDFGQTSLKAQAMKMQKMALQEQLAYKKREAQSDFELSMKYIKIAKENILTTEQNVVANQKTFNAIDKKYQARVVDNVSYLDALNSLIEARAMYEKSINDYNLEIAKYYNNQGQNIENYITKEMIK